MKQVLQNFKTGELMVEDVPRPQVRPGTVLVQNYHSLISTGTEGGTVKLGRMSLLGKARARPEQVKKVWKVVLTEGLLTAYRAATRTLEVPIPLGYSCAGRIMEVGAGISDLKVGDLVACAGANLAVHAEDVVIPRNLCVKVPDGVDMRQAAFTTVGAIALQGLRLSGVQLGDHVVVIGLGLVGLLTVELLKASGARVLGIDTDESRVSWTQTQGFCPAVVRSAPNLVEQVMNFTRGAGADKVIITAAAPTNDPVALAGELSRIKGRVVVVGRTEMTAPRDTYLFKELELCPSYAYGPGTGDPNYEEKGQDYPLAYVRWTENRNMVAFLDQVAAGKLNIPALITHEFPVVQAPQAYELITGQTYEPCVAVILTYDQHRAEEPPRLVISTIPRTQPTLPGDVVRVGVIGAGSFATNFMLPTLAGEKGVKLTGITSATGVRAQALGRKYGFTFCTADPNQVFQDPDTDAVVVLTRHDTHAAYTIAALKAGKHVFVEKPLAMTRAELDEVIRVQKETGLTVLVGFNRPWSSLSLKLAEFFQGRTQPMSIIYRGNVGYRPPEHWLHDPCQGGGVLLGEACHFLDYCLWLTGAAPVDVHVWTLTGQDSRFIDQDNFHILLRLSDGSVASLAYLSCGDPAAGREKIEVLAEGGSAEMVDFTSLSLTRRGRQTAHRRRLSPDKGYQAEIQAFLAAVRGQGNLGLIFQRQVMSMSTTLAALDSLVSGQTLPVSVQ